MKVESLKDMAAGMRKAAYIPAENRAFIADLLEAIARNMEKNGLKEIKIKQVAE